MIEYPTYVSDKRSILEYKTTIEASEGEGGTFIFVAQNGHDVKNFAFNYYFKGKI